MGGSGLVVKESVPFLLLGTAVTVIVGVLGPAVLAVIPGLMTVWVAWFFRDPPRRVPEGEGLVVSPADGRILEVQEHDGFRRVSIFMGLMDCHINRIPLGGRVLDVTHRSGRFRAAFRSSAMHENEQSVVVIETPHGWKIRIVQVAGMVARRIRCWIKPGDEVKRGMKYGMICFGSRLDAYFPLDIVLQVHPGDRVRGAETVLGVLAGGGRS